jgi:hypothetical protein
MSDALDRLGRILVAIVLGLTLLGAIGFFLVGSAERGAELSSTRNWED